MINIYSPIQPHYPGTIIGSQNDLENLKDAITDSLNGESGTFNAFDSNGEQYSINVYMLSETTQLKSHYKDDGFNL